MVSIPNIYASKHIKLMIAVPIILMLIGVYLSSQIVLDTSLRGGVSVTLQLNKSVSTSGIAAMVSSRLGMPAASVSVATSPGGIDITIPANSSLAAAENYLLGFYTFKSNYTSYAFNATSAQIALQKDPANQTLKNESAVATAGMNKSVQGMVAELSGEVAALKPLTGTIAYNASQIENLSSIAQNAYTNASSIYKNHIIEVLHSVVPFSVYSYQQVTPTLSRYFLSQVEEVIIVAFLLISIAVFAVFRSAVPSLAMIFGTGNDIIIALGAMGLFKIPLGLASLGGLLMLIGYSIDTELLTSIRILKRREGTVEERAYGAMRTGITMTSAAIVSFAVLFIVSLVTYIPTYYEISGVVLFGLIGDLFTTWLVNAPMIMLYKKHKEKM